MDAKPFKFGMILGRFQGMHLGHVHMIERGLQSCNQLLVMIGSSQESFTMRNPFTHKVRADIIRSAFKNEILEGKLLLAHIDDMTNEDDNSVEWGDYVLQRVEMWKKYFEVPYDLDLIITGEESVRRDWFRKDAVKNINQLVLSRDQVPISATAMRKYLATDDLESWIKWMPVSPEGNSRMSIDEAKNLYNELREELFRAPDYQIKGSVDV